jgi:glycosyltransferase involved in cell wall biosynthesis
MLVALLLIWHRVVLRRRYDVVQSVESNSLFGDVVHAQYCHRWFLAHAWAESRPPGLRRPVRFLFEFLSSRLEPLVMRRAARVVVPSQGTAVALSDTFPFVRPKIRYAYNGIGWREFKPPTTDQRDLLRGRLDLADDQLVLVFVALGHFERKGLPHVLDALELLDRHVVLLVVGGTDESISPYRRRVVEGTLARRVRFLGPTTDVRPFLWASDAFVLPTSFEGFPFAAIEAAAAGLPLIATSVNGIEEILQDDHNGYVVERNAESIANAIKRLALLDADGVQTMKRHSRESVSQFDKASMVGSWRKVYCEIGVSTSGIMAAKPAQSDREKV